MLVYYNFLFTFGWEDTVDSIFFHKKSGTSTTTITETLSKKTKSSMLKKCATTTKLTGKTLSQINLTFSKPNHLQILSTKSNLKTKSKRTVFWTMNSRGLLRKISTWICLNMNRKYWRTEKFWSIKGWKKHNFWRRKIWTTVQSFWERIMRTQRFHGMQRQKVGKRRVILVIRDMICKIWWIR